MVAKLLKLRHAPQPADAADGVAAALCACLSASLPKLPPLKLPSLASVKLAQAKLAQTKSTTTSRKTESRK
jgi:crossover junction endodeoxyribonuclease RuvC